MFFSVFLVCPVMAPLCSAQPAHLVAAALIECAILIYKLIRAGELVQNSLPLLSYNTNAYENKMFTGVCIEGGIFLFAPGRHKGWWRPWAPLTATLANCNLSRTLLPSCFFAAKKSDHITPILHDLHWLPIQFRIQFKYFYLQRTSSLPIFPRSWHLLRLWGLFAPEAVLPSWFLDLTALALVIFSIVAPRLWNEFPASILNASSVASFKSLLKTHLFRAAFPTFV